MLFLFLFLLGAVYICQKFEIFSIEIFPFWRGPAPGLITVLLSIIFLNDETYLCEKLPCFWRIQTNYTSNYFGIKHKTFPIWRRNFKEITKRHNKICWKLILIYKYFVYYEVSAVHNFIIRILLLEFIIKPNSQNAFYSINIRN